MLRNNSLITRIAVGKLAGFAIGLAGFVVMPLIYADAGWLARWGILLWYTTVGAVIGLAGVFTRHPVLRIGLPWWLRDPLLGAWLNFVLTFFAHDLMARFLAAMFGPDGLLASPFWFVAEGALVGLVVGYLAKRFGGEGPEIVDR